MDIMLKNKKLMITGGTGSFGEAVLERFLDTDIHQITVFSRDEKKHEDMRRKYKNEKLSFYLGDIRDRESILSASKEVDFIFHAAALKQVPSCEFFPIEAVKTNVIGTENLLEAAMANSVEKVICLSTDKAVYPINAMGMSKALMEKVLVSKSRISSSTTIIGTRYGNVLGSRGSVLPLFLDQLSRNVPLTITDPEMTRFVMSLDEAVDLVMFAFAKGNPGDIFVQKAPACTIEQLYKSFLSIVNKKDYPVETIGIRHGEKLYETLCSSEEMFVAEDLGNYYRIPRDERDLNYEAYFEEGNIDVSKVKEFNSNNCLQLEEKELEKILQKEKIFKAYY